MLNIHERYRCGMPVIIEGETGVGKTALLEMLSKLWNESLFIEWKVQLSRIFDFCKKNFPDIPVCYLHFSIIKGAALMCMMFLGCRTTATRRWSEPIIIT